MKLEVGKYYRACDGRKVGPMVLWDAAFGSWPFEVLDGRNCSEARRQLWSLDGRGDEGLNLIAEWAEEPAAPQPAGPVRMVQVKKIVDGAYGTVVVSDKGRLVRAKYMSDATTIRAAIATLSEIADAMEENSK